MLKNESPKIIKDPKLPKCDFLNSVRLGVRYVLEGSVRKAGSFVRITGQLIEAATGAHLWADKFDGSLENVFELQDNVARSVVGAIVPQLKRIPVILKHSLHA